MTIVFSILLFRKHFKCKYNENVPYTKKTSSHQVPLMHNYKDAAL